MTGFLPTNLRTVAGGAPVVASGVRDLAVVIIAKNEEKYIAGCIESVLKSAATISGTDVVLIDSCSRDQTVSIAKQLDVRTVVLRDSSDLSPALARLVGQQLTSSRYILFVDGDTEIEGGWLQAALTALDLHPDVAGVGGKLREVYYRNDQVVGENPDCFNSGNDVSAVDQLGGNAVYRRAALQEVGSFNPYVLSYEEAELAERLRRGGYRVVRLPIQLGTHRTGLPGSLSELRRRYRERLITGYGQVLRIAINDGLFLAHASRMKRYLQFQAFVLAGLLAAVVSVFMRNPVTFVLWLAGAAILFGALAAKSRSVGKPARLVLDWSFWMLPMIRGFLQTPRDPRQFELARVVREA